MTYEVVGINILSPQRLKRGQAATCTRIRYPIKLIAITRRSLHPGWQRKNGRCCEGLRCPCFMCNHRKVRTDKGGKCSKRFANGVETDTQQAIVGTTRLLPWQMKQKLLWACCSPLPHTHVTVASALALESAFGGGPFGSLLPLPLPL